VYAGPHQPPQHTKLAQQPDTLFLKVWLAATMDEQHSLKQMRCLYILLFTLSFRINKLSDNQAQNQLPGSNMINGISAKGNNPFKDI